jgi:hypothetical protein
MKESQFLTTDNKWMFVPAASYAAAFRASSESLNDVH